LLLVVVTMLASVQPLYALIGILLIAAVFLCFLMPNLVVYLFVASFPFISHIPRGNFIPILKFDEALILVGIIVWLVSPGFHQEIAFYLDRWIVYGASIIGNSFTGDWASIKRMAH
jgi:hypothetical protein